ncbi:uncharacterized protein LOC131026017 [Salvia miltiorrhiza]|uniref:uncharacterized protein LOC131026017 n=1 Tax=Salvia miltiorrhiza TaxID=226208 RepID=UPI0025AC5033|nr:uncharacterized protein LOC131026017 [Salvia miltiorrhiza]
MPPQTLHQIRLFHSAKTPARYHRRKLPTSHLPLPPRNAPARNRCNCFNGNSNDSSDDELDFFSDSISANSSFGNPSDNASLCKSKWDKSPSIPAGNSQFHFPPFFLFNTPISPKTARQSLKKKGMHIAPWRKADYMKSKWLSPHAAQNRHRRGGSAR